MNQLLSLTLYQENKILWGHAYPSVHEKYKCFPRLCATFLGSEPTSTCPALGFTVGFVCATSAAAYKGSSLTLALPFPFYFRAPYNVRQKSVDLDEEDVPFTPDEHKKRYGLRVTTFLCRGSDKWTYLSLTVHYWEGQFDDDYSRAIRAGCNEIIISRYFYTERIYAHRRLRSQQNIIKSLT